MTNLTELRSALQQALLAPLPTHHATTELSQFYALIRDYPQRPGKAIRGLLLLLSAEVHGGNWREALPVAAALELFQNWVLIHDDIEDDSEERRGAPALHKQVGVPIALNVGDALHVYMWDYLLEALEGHAERRAITQEFLRMIHRTAEGQHLDLSWIREGRFDISEAQYLEMVTLKTAYYTVISPLRLGALCAGVLPDERLEEAGRYLGIAFQIRDDVLNLTPSNAYGKEFAGDLYEAKRTLIIAHLLACAEEDVQQRVLTALHKPRAARTEDDVHYLLRQIMRTGSLHYAQQVATGYAERGLALVRATLQPLANQNIADELTGLLETLAQRRA
jgi:geranylgeranyl diphosphate synthase type II